MTRLSEKRDIQDQLINHLIGIGWEYLPPQQALEVRDGNRREPFLLPLAQEQLVALNPGLVSEDNADDVLHGLRGLRPNMVGNEEFLSALRGQRAIFDRQDKRERNLTLIDYESHRNNRFTFTQEFRFQDRDERRLDIVFFVNGFPVALIENKNPALEEGELAAFDQVQRLYSERIPELLKYVQFFATCDVRVHYGATWNQSLKAFYRWKTDGKDYGLERLSKSLFDHGNLLRMLRDYVVFFRADDETHKFVLRPHQIRAVERIVGRVADNVGRGDTDLLDQGIRSGLIWHTQGSGKTLTMIVASNKLRQLSALENPTILVVVDRLELESQMVQNLESFGFPTVTRAQSKAHLRELLGSDYRGLIVTLVHKFDRMPKSLNARNNVVVLVDEAHRTQEGDLATYMRAALPNAFYFGFTGTPIDRGRIGQGTFETFGKADPEGYQDKYGIDESIEDETTLPLYYTLAPTELRVDRDRLEEEFYKIVDEVGVASFEELDRLLDKADGLKAVLKAGSRVEAVAEHIAQHFTENVEPLNFKAFVVAIDREGCALYKEALDRYLPSQYSRVVYTADHKDPELMRKFHLADEEEKRIRKAFRAQDEMPKILIVTQKLLTGFDAPVLYAMYLDKPLKDHTLLQAIARVNRPYHTKESGLIVDYIGIFENLQRALAFDLASVQTGLIDLEILKERFAEQMAEAQTMLEPLKLHEVQGRTDRIVDYFFDVERREAYIKLFKAIEQAYEILSPDPFLRDYLDDYALLAQVYQVLYNVFDPEAEKKRVERDLLRKTDSLIRQHVSVQPIVDTLPLYRIDRDIASVVQADNVSERVKVANLYRSILVHIEANQDQRPYLVSIGDRVETVIQQLKERQISVQAALEEMTAMAEELVAAEDEQEESELAVPEFALFWVLRGQGLPAPDKLAVEAGSVLASHAGWPYNDDLERNARRELYKILKEVPSGRMVKDAPGAYDAGRGRAAAMKETVDSLLRMHRMVAQ
jgi:type I restriction enzyme R subunit